MGIVVVQSAKITMKTFVALSARVAAAVAAPAAEADAQYLAGLGYAGLAGYTGLAGVAAPAGVAGQYAAAPAVAATAVAPAAVAPAATVAVAHAAPAVATVPVAQVQHTVHQPIVPVHQVREYVVTAPVVRHVGTQVHHQVHHVPQVHVDTKTSHAVSTHIINHPPQVGAFVAPGAAALPLGLAATPLIAVPVAVAAAEPAEAAEAAESA